MRLLKSLIIAFITLNLTTLETVAEEALRTVALSPVACEILSELDLEQLIVGATNTCRLKSAHSFKNLGGYGMTSTEAVYALKPDLIILTEGASNQESQFQKLGLRTLVINTNKLNSFKSSFIEVGKILNKEELARNIISNKQQYISKLAKENTSSNVLMLFSEDTSHYSSSSFYAIGMHTFYNDILEQLGLENALKASGYLEMSLEGVCSINTNCIIVATSDLSDKITNSVSSCKQEAKIIKTSATSFLIPGVGFDRIAETISSCRFKDESKN